MQTMKVLNYLKSISSICGGSIKENGVAWVIFVLLLLSDYKFALLFWIIPLVTLFVLEWWKFKGKEYSWDIILTPVVNFYALSALILGPIIEWISHGKVKD